MLLGFLWLVEYLYVVVRPGVLVFVEREGAACVYLYVRAAVVFPHPTLLCLLVITLWLLTTRPRVRAFNAPSYFLRPSRPSKTGLPPKHLTYTHSLPDHPQATQVKGTVLPLPKGPGPVEFVAVTDVRTETHPITTVASPPPLWSIDRTVRHPSLVLRSRTFLP